MASSLKINAATTDTEAFVYDPAELDAARVIAVLVPGALCRIGIFEAAQPWREHGYGLVHYRFPGLDGRPVNPLLKLDDAAAAIEHLVRRYPHKPLRLVGFSTGAAVVIKSAALMPDRDLRVAAIAPAVERAGGLKTMLRGTADVLRAALAVRDVRVGPVWFSYYRALLYGRGVFRHAETARRASAVIAARRNRIVVPTPALVRAHTRDLKRWRLSEEERALPHPLRIFRGSEDTIFDRAQIERFAHRCGAEGVKTYPGHGHLLFATCPEVFDDVFGFFDASDRA